MATTSKNHVGVPFMRAVIDHLRYSGLLDTERLESHLQSETTFDNIKYGRASGKGFGMQSYYKLCFALRIKPYEPPSVQKQSFRPIRIRLREKIRRHREGIKEAERYLQMMKDKEAADIKVSDIALAERKAASANSEE